MANDVKPKLRQGQPALQLDPARASTPTVFPGVINGVLFPGVPVALSELGLSRRAADLLISDGLPFSLTRIGDASKEG